MALLRKVLQAFRGIDRRQLQLEIDMHRLFLLTSYHKMKSESDNSSADDVIALAERLSAEERQRAVQENVHKQVIHISQAMDEILLLKQPKHEETTSQAQRNQPSGLSFAVGQKTIKQQNPEKMVPCETRSLSFYEVALALKSSLGYTLERRPSQIDHKEAGQGVFLDGKVGPGAVVSFYPGIIYSPSQYRHMPGFPRMDVINSFLVSRYDGLVIDGKPWGCGGESRELWDGSEGKAADEQEGMEETPGAKDKTGIWSAICGRTLQVTGARQAALVERRNPLALAHYINHPVQGRQPNVMLCPYDFICTKSNVRPYIPNVHFDDHEEMMRRRGLLWVHDRKAEEDSMGSMQDYGEASVVRTIVLVATKEICDEELFLNYRLSNHQKWPAWYHPVDAEEDKRRWY